MANQGVNLLTIEKKREKKIGSFFTISLLVLIIVIFASIGLLLFTLFLKTNLSAVTQAESTALASLDSYKSKKIKVLTISERLGNIQKIVSVNKKVYNNVFPIEESIPAGISVNSLQADETAATFTLVSSSLATLNNYLNVDLKKLADSKNARVKTINIDDFSLTDNGQYSTTLHFTFH